MCVCTCTYCSTSILLDEQVRPILVRCTEASEAGQKAGGGLSKQRQKGDKKSHCVCGMVYSCVLTCVHPELCMWKPEKVGCPPYHSCMYFLDSL